MTKNYDQLPDQDQFNTQDVYEQRVAALVQHFTPIIRRNVRDWHTPFLEHRVNNLEDYHKQELIELVHDLWVDGTKPVTAYTAEEIAAELFEDADPAEYPNIQDEIAYYTELYEEYIVED